MCDARYRESSVPCGAVSWRDDVRVLEQDGPLLSHHDYILCVAALSTEYWSEVKRRVSKKGKPVVTFLEAACRAPGGVGNMNNVRMQNSKAARCVRKVWCTEQQLIFTFLDFFQQVCDSSGER